MSPSTIGPYRVARVIGEGAMGVVYAARGPDGAEVALKTATAVAEGALDGLRREIRALSRLRHPGIARIVDQGVEDGVPWYAMERVRGTPLNRYFGRRNAEPSAHGTFADLDDAELPDLPTDEAPRPDRAAFGRLPQALSILCGLSHTLAWLHGEGIVHRDLKPANVLVDEEGWPVLIDFGLAARFSAGGREALGDDRRRGGTVNSMSPEQIRGEALDARADLYALGCVIYDVLCGRPPFVSASAGAVLRAHLEEPPVPPSERVDGVPPELDALVLGLLAKDPARRIGRASEVARALERLGAAVGRDDLPAPRSYLYRPRLRGRADALAALEGWLRDGRPAVRLVGGPAGIGRTRLAQEAARLAGGRAVLEVDCLLASAEGGRLASLRDLVGAIADRCRASPALRERVRGPDTAVLAPGFPALAGLVAHGSSAPPDELALLRALTAVVERACAGRGALVLIDDLHLADPLTIGWVGHVARTRPPGILLLATFRAEEEPAALRALLGRSDVAVDPLPPLAAAHVADLVHDLLGAAPAPAVAEGIARASGGNPFLVAELARAGLSAAPGALADLLAPRIAELDPAERALVEALAIAGTTAPLAPLRALLGEVAGPVASLVGRGLVEEVGTTRVRFVNVALREVALRRIPAAERPARHRRWAEALAATDAGEPEALAEHWREAGDPPRARAAWRAAVARAAPFDPPSAARFAEAWLALAEGAAPEEEVEILLALAAARTREGRVDEALAAAERARRIAAGLGRAALEVEALTVATRAAANGGRLRERLALALACLDGARALDRSARARAWLLLADARLALGEFDATREAIDAARAEGDPTVERAATFQEGLLRFRRGAFVEALACVEALPPGCEPTHDNLRANVLKALGRYDEAAAAYDEAHRLWHAAGDLRGAAVARANLAILLHAMGRAADSDRTYAEALATFEELEDLQYQGHACAFLALFARERGELDRALAWGRRAHAALVEVDDRAWLPRVEAELALVHLARRELAEAERWARTAVARPEVPTQPATLALAEVLIAGGRAAEAAALLEGWLPRAPPGRPARQGRVALAAARLALDDPPGAAAALPPAPDAPPGPEERLERAREATVRARLARRLGLDPAPWEEHRRAALAGWPYAAPADLG